MITFSRQVGVIERVISERRRVLVVEDHALTRVLIDNALTHAGFDITAVSTADEAIALMGSFDPDLLLSDIDLGGHPNGAELAVILHAQAPYLAIVLMSNYSALNQVAGYRSLPAGTQFMRKTSISDTQSLLEVIEGALRTVKSNQIVRESKDNLTKSDLLALLTQTQIDVLRLVAAGCSNKEIARIRGSNVGAIEKILTKVFRALQVDTDPALNPRVSSARAFIREFGPVEIDRPS